MYSFYFQILFKKKLFELLLFILLYSAHESLSHITFSPTLGKLPTEHLCEIMDTSMETERRTNEISMETLDSELSL